MPKNVVLCCDGTANEFASDWTNVIKLFAALKHVPGEQVACYHPGLGTMEAAGAVTSIGRKVTKLLGKAIGYGLEADVRDACVFLMNHFEDGDRVFLFGFSRGAYTVRVVASLLYMYGLLHRGNEAMVPYAIRMLTAIDRAQRDADAAKVQDPEVARMFDRARAFRAAYQSRTCKPWFVGVWDTVSSVGWIENPLKVPFTANNPDIEIGRHAIALDERRAFFRTNRWRPASPPRAAGPRDLKQVWFPGVHCDVGGGYPECQSGLSKLSLRWMLRQACKAGLLVDQERVDLVLGRRGEGFAAPDPNAKMHESLKGLWRLAEFIPKRRYDEASGAWTRRCNRFRRRTIPEKAMVHESAWQRDGDYAKVLPATAVRVTDDD